MSSTVWLTRRSVSLCLSEHSPARSHRSDEPTTRDSPGRCSAPDLPSRLGSEGQSLETRRGSMTGPEQAVRFL
jgi:hypothetical protein